MFSLPIAFRLAVRQWRAKPLRPILCSLAIAAAVALIVGVGAGFESLRYSMRTTIGQMLGVADLHVRPAQRNTGQRLPGTMLEEIRARKDVDMAAGRMEAHVALTSQGSGGSKLRWFEAVGVDPVYDPLLRPRMYIAGRAVSGKLDEIAVGADVAEVMNVKVGDSVSVSGDGQTERQAVVVGIVKKPAIELLSKPTVYMPIAALAGDLRMTPQFNVIDVKLSDAANMTDYDAYAVKMSQELGPSVLVSAGTNSKARLANETRIVNIILMLIGIIAAICAALIIGTTLSVGVQERVRQFGQLRCIGASRSQLTTFLLGDAAVMLAIGEVLGVIFGFVFSWLLVWHFSQYFLKYQIAASSVVIAAIVGCAATLLGAMIPIWQVTRVSPMAAVVVVARTRRPRLIWGAAVVGLLCLATQLLLWFGVFSNNVRFFLYVCLGVPLIFVGWTLLGPAVLMVCESFGSTLIGRILAVRPALLRHAWSSTPWRAGGMIAALMIGVTLFTTVRARGQSLHASWVSPARLPDLLLYSVVDALPIGPISSLLPDIAVRAKDIKARHTEIADITPIISFSVKIQTNFARGGEVLGVDGPHFVGVDPESFTRLVAMEYYQPEGSPRYDPAIAVRQLIEGRHIFVSKEFYELRGLGVGDKITFIAANGRPVDFTIAAIVTSTGIELVKNYFDMRSIFADHAVTAVLGNMTDAKTYFRARAGSMMLVNIKPGVSMAAVARMRQKLQQEGFPSVSSFELKAGIGKIIDHVVDTLTIIALGALVMASLGVANMVIASVHARRFEFGVLRAIGSGRGQLIRLVLAEVTLIGLVAGALGAGAGLYFAAMAGAVEKLLVGIPNQYLASNVATMFGLIGSHLLIAICLTTLLAWLAAVVPAIRGAFSAQRTLLAAGRG
ncbi:MAG: ABC transporter permease [Phycisphaerales bacterium]|nr:ABC transporter permease [Phycisphaerales bacterium]